MSALLAIAGLLVTAAPNPPVQSVDAAYQEMVAHQNSDAIARIEAEGPLAADHPAQLINLGVAYARQGNVDRARVLFRRAANADGGYSLETASGKWESARVLALRALASLDSGRLGGVTRTASR